MGSAAAVHVTGSVKFDGAEMDRGNPRTRQLVCQAGIAPDDIVFLAGSTQAPEEALALDVFQRLSPQAAADPRAHPERFEVAACSISRASPGNGAPIARPTDPPGESACRSIGELGAWWGRPHRLCRR
jgi:3-deoxy-D-manno-octulosonic-acid transferase